jgi:hypothetical protein
MIGRSSIWRGRLFEVRTLAEKTRHGPAQLETALSQESAREPLAGRIPTPALHARGENTDSRFKIGPSEALFW